MTHDRVFLEKLATRIVELDRGRLYDWACDYPTFLKRRDELLQPRPSNRSSSTRGWPRRKRGSEKESKRGEPAMKAAFAHSRRCARLAASVASDRAIARIQPRSRAVGHARDRSQERELRLR